MSKEYPVKGLAQLDAYLSVLPRNLQTGAYRAALTAAAAPIRDEARLRAPRVTGQLAASIKSGSPRRNADGSFSIHVGPRGRPQGGNAHAFLGYFHEYGVRPHYLNSGTSKLKPRKLNNASRDGGYSDVQSKALVINGEFIRGLILHPGYAPKPFLRPALDAAAGKAVQAFADRIRLYIEQKTGFTAPIDIDEAA